MSKRWWLIAGILILAGVGVSVGDYRVWRYEETRDYGHGPIESLAPALELSQRYVNEYAGIRLRYPEGWTAEEKLKNMVKIAEAMVPFRPNKLTEVVEITGPGGGAKVTVYVNRTEGDLVGELETEVRRVGVEGGKLVREREYLNTDREDWGVLTWEAQGQTVRRAVAVSGEMMAVVEASCETEKLDQYVRTLDEIIKGLTVIT